MKCSECNKEITEAVEAISRQPVCKECWDEHLYFLEQQSEIRRCELCHHLSHVEDFVEASDGIICRFCAEEKHINHKQIIFFDEFGSITTVEKQISYKTI